MGAWSRVRYSQFGVAIPYLGSHAGLIDRSLHPTGSICKAPSENYTENHVDMMFRSSAAVNNIHWLP